MQIKDILQRKDLPEEKISPDAFGGKQTNSESVL